MPSSPVFESGLVWFRRDLRALDQAALYHALCQCKKVFAVFVYDADILKDLPPTDRRVEFIYHALVDLNAQLHHLSQGRVPTTEPFAAPLPPEQPTPALLILRHGKAVPQVVQLAKDLGVQAVFTNHDDEPASLARDGQVQHELAAIGVAWQTYKDHVIFERQEVLTQSGKPYTVFTPYKNAWLKKLNPFFLKSYPVAAYGRRLAPPPASVPAPWLDLPAIGFAPTAWAAGKVGHGTTGAHALMRAFLQRIDRYDTARDFPAVKGPSYLGIHLRFGTLSIRQMAALAWQLAQRGNRGAQVWLSELIWRDFYAQIMANFPHVIGASFKPAYDAIAWESGEVAATRFAAWCKGATGYPLVDAAMLQLNQTGYMHNRLRMVAASFLCKHLGVGWRWGEAYFAKHLNDFELASNNGGWQWASSSGCDAQPYFRIFNPVTQSQKFDQDARFITRYLPVLGQLPVALRHTPWLADESTLAAAQVQLGGNYPWPIVDHAQARAQTLLRYSCVKAGAGSPALDQPA